MTDNKPHHHYPWLDETPEDSYVMSLEETKAFAKAYAKKFGFKPNPRPDPEAPEGQRQLADEVLRMKDEPK